MRLLVASPLGNVIEPTLSASFPAAKLIVARDRAEVVHAVTDIEKVDVVLADPVWNDPEQEFRFDGLDVLEMVRESRSGTAVLLAGQGHSMERDFGRIIAQRREHESHGELTPAVVYRWCGLHARYLMSWCRRNGHTEVLTHGDES